MKRVMFILLMIAVLILGMACGRNEEDAVKDSPSAQAAAGENTGAADSKESADTAETTALTEAGDAQNSENDPTEENDIYTGEIEITWFYSEEGDIPDLDIQITDTAGNLLAADSEDTEDSCRARRFMVTGDVTPSLICITGNDPVNANEIISSTDFEIMLMQDITGDNVLNAFAFKSSLGDCFKRSYTGAWYYEIPIDWTTGDIGNVGTSFAESDDLQ